MMALVSIIVVAICWIYIIYRGHFPAYDEKMYMDQEISDHFRRLEQEYDEERSLNG
jgi:hypothetical protein